MSRSQLTPIAILVILTIFHLASIKTFDPWSQVTLVWSSGHPLLAYAGDFHFYRTLIASPGLWLEEIWPNHGFSTYVSLCLFLVSSFLVRTQELLSGRPPQAWAWLLLLTLFMLMNGRGALGWAGWMLCVHACLGVMMGVRPGLSMRTTFQCVLGLLFAAVSSGIFIASVVLIVYFMFAAIIRRKQRPRWNMSARRLIDISLVVITVPVLGYFISEHLFYAIEKVLRFYGGGLSGIIGAATHGIASQFETITAMHVLGGGLVLSLGAVMSFLGYRKRVDPNLVVAIFISLFGGVFGVIILTLSFPLIIIATGTVFRVRANMYRIR